MQKLTKQQWPALWTYDQGFDQAYEAINETNEMPHADHNFTDFQSGMMELSVLTPVLLMVGALTILFFFLDLIWSLLQVSRAVLAPLFLPNEENALARKYGPWACKFICNWTNGKLFNARS